MKILTLATIAALALPLAAQAQETSTIKANNIKDNIYVLIGEEGGNVTASIGEDGVFIIDDQLGDQSDALIEAIESISDREITFVMNTHYHFDHTGNNEMLGEDEAVILAHDNVRKRLSSDQYITFFKKNTHALKPEGLPKVTFDQDMSLHYNGDTVKLTHLPNAHTDGDAIAHFIEDNIIVAGDTIFNGMYPFIDAEHGGSIKGIIAAQDKIIMMADEQTVIIPGHGAILNKAELLTQRNALDDIKSKIELAIAQGQTKEETIASKPTAEYDTLLNNGFIKADTFVSFLYDHLGE